MSASLKKTALALFMFTSLTFSFAQTADEIINKHISAMGGKEKLAALKTLKITGSTQGGPGIEFPTSIVQVDGKSSRMELTVQGMTMMQVVDGDSGWYISPFEGKKDAERMDQEMITSEKEGLDLAGDLFNYKAKGHSVEYLGKEDMEGSDTYKLKLTKKSGSVHFLYLDASNYYLLKETVKEKFKDKEVESESLFSNYKTENGYTFPYAQETREKGASSGQTFTITKYAINPVIDPAIFKMPKPAAKTTETKTPAAK